MEPFAMAFFLEQAGPLQKPSLLICRHHITLTNLLHPIEDGKAGSAPPVLIRILLQRAQRCPENAPSDLMIVTIPRLHEGPPCVPPSTLAGRDHAITRYPDMLQYRSSGVVY